MVLEFEPESRLLKKQKHKKGKGSQIDIYNCIPNVNHHPQSLLLLFSIINPRQTDEWHSLA